MEQQFKMLLDQMKLEMQKQTIELKESITKNIMDKIDEKLSPLITENNKLKKKVEDLENEIEYLKRGNKENNIIIYGLEESEKSTSDLFQKITYTLKNESNVHLQESEVNKIRRLGKQKVSSKPRPVLCVLINKWKKDEILKGRKNLKTIYISEDYTKEVLEKRKALIPRLQEEKRKGKVAFIKYDQLIVKESNTNFDKRKREPSTSPKSPSNTQTKKLQTISSIKSNRTNAFDIMRTRSNSLTSIPQNNNQ
ncbi:PREDICTED: uncharacterized protein LOC106122718 [Papilio xuthus]|uniref:Uncharacterized protein LOC106122718 n=1 Tax=Papilio xuthus TaxID=66420 RepID=A0AAJ6ZKH1_PAPXU|nr:PREDICTED: uncharacterized protein LOC106122718 [Papilio xuthus]